MQTLTVDVIRILTNGPGDVSGLLDLIVELEAGAA